eukprot:8061996-Pyramimonas_sp.AAC.1
MPRLDGAHAFLIEPPLKVNLSPFEVNSPLIEVTHHPAGEPARGNAHVRGGVRGRPAPRGQQRGDAAPGSGARGRSEHGHHAHGHQGAIPPPAHANPPLTRAKQLGYQGANQPRTTSPVCSAVPTLRERRTQTIIVSLAASTQPPWIISRGKVTLKNGASVAQRLPKARAAFC